MPSGFLSAATSPGARTDSPNLDSPQQSPPCLQTPCTRSAPGSVPHVVTIAEVSELPDPTTKITRQRHSESDISNESNTRYGVGVTSGSSQRATSTGVLVEETSLNVEESILEHRRLTQTSPGSSTVRSDDDFIVISSNVSSNSTPEPELQMSGVQTPVGTPGDLKDTPLHSMARYKAHRRSLSSSQIDIISSVCGGGPGIIEGTNSSASGWNSSSIEENQLSTRDSSTADLEDRSRASSLLTNDTNSMHELSTSDEEGENGGGIKASISLHLIGGTSPTKQQLFYEASDAVNEVVVRDSDKRSRLRGIKAKRYSADFHLISNAEGSEEKFTIKQRTISTELLDTTPDALRLPQKPSLFSSRPSDGVFRVPADLSPSDIEVSIKSGESSLENSQSALFFKATGSPKTIKKLKGKSPLLSRRSTIAHSTKYEQDNRGLTKEKVKPTINALKSVLKSASDSEEGDQQGDSVFEFSQNNVERLMSSPLLRCPPSELVDQECTSLDFVPGKLYTHCTMA